jgi:hypothetical protein
MTNDNLFVYVLRSERVPDRYYTGMSDDLERPLAVHNSGGSKYTCKLRPWQSGRVLELLKPGECDRVRAVSKDRLRASILQAPLRLSEGRPKYSETRATSLYFTSIQDVTAVPKFSPSSGNPFGNIAA